MDSLSLILTYRRMLNDAINLVHNKILCTIKSIMKKTDQLNGIFIFNKFNRVIYSITVSYKIDSSTGNKYNRIDYFNVYVIKEHIPEKYTLIYSTNGDKYETLNMDEVLNFIFNINVGRTLNEYIKPSPGFFGWDNKQQFNEILFKPQRLDIIYSNDDYYETIRKVIII
jgi:hypothetical protein